MSSALDVLDSASFFVVPYTLTIGITLMLTLAITFDSRHICSLYKVSLWIYFPVWVS